MRERFTDNHDDRSILVCSEELRSQKGGKAVVVSCYQKKRCFKKRHKAKETRNNISNHIYLF